MRFTPKTYSGSRYATLMWLDLATVILSGIWVNLLTAKQSHGGILMALSALGWTNLWLLFAVVGVCGHIFLGRRWAKSDEQQASGLEAALRFDVLKVAVEGIRSLRADIRINARYFATESRGGQIILRKDQSIHIETAHMPGEYGLDYAVVGVDDLGICKAYQQRGPVFEVLHGGEHYGPRIANYIDPHQKWVLACPVLAPNTMEESPLGVICFYSTENVVRNERDELQLKQVAVVAAKAFADLRRLHQQD